MADKIINTEFWDALELQKVVGYLKSSNPEIYTLGFKSICDEYQRLKIRIKTLERIRTTILYNLEEEVQRETRSKTATKLE